METFVKKSVRHLVYTNNSLYTPIVCTYDGEVLQSNTDKNIDL